jgi:DNA-binding transcriptional LysR family regulator
MELDSTEAILNCVEAGLGVGFVSKWAMERRALAIVRIEQHPMMRMFSFVLPKGPEPQPLAATLKRFLEASQSR